MRAVVWTLVAALAVLTLLPLLPSEAWWVRLWEFPRRILFGLSVITVGLAGGVLRGRGRLVASGTAAAVALWQALWLWPYAPWAPEEVQVTAGTGDVTILAANVLQENADHAAVVALLRDVDPDIVLLMETDRAWADGLAEALENWPERAARIADDHYGMILATRLPVADLRLERLEGRDTPYGVLEVVTAGGPLLITALHPRPPVPGTSRRDRDAQIERASRLARRTDIPAVAVGDFNDVGWSRSGRRFREIGDWRDVRRGRGPMPTFDATRWWWSVPIDQALLTEGVRLHRMELGPDIGSDHRPVVVEVSVGSE